MCGTTCFNPQISFPRFALTVFVYLIHPLEILLSPFFFILSNLEIIECEHFVLRPIILCFMGIHTCTHPLLVFNRNRVETACVSKIVLDLFTGYSWDQISHDDVIKWKNFPRYWPSVRGIHRSPVNSPHKGQWRGALKFCLICAWKSGFVNNGEAGDLRCHRAHYDVIIMQQSCYQQRKLTCLTKSCKSAHVRCWLDNPTLTIPLHCGNNMPVIG